MSGSDSSGGDSTIDSRAGAVTRVDSDRLDELVKEVLTQGGADSIEGVETVLKKLGDKDRVRYRQPLLDRLSNVSLLTVQLDEELPEPTVETDVETDTVERGESALVGENDDASPTAATIDLAAATVRRGEDSERRDDSLPETIGKFEIKSELGRGAFGVVYLGYDRELQRKVAIKVSLVSDATLQERLRIEASKVAQVESNGIVPVYHIGKTSDDRVYIVQKYIEGSTLRAILRSGPLSPNAAARLIREIAIGLEPAHLEDIVHRDLKPDNILIGLNGRAWIADFGLAISEDEQQEGKRELAGTPPYMSPEQIKGRIDFIDPRSDIWALGVMFYESLCGKLPFSARDRRTLATQIAELDPRPLHQRAPDHLTPDMHRVFQRACSKRPADRYANVRELAIDLEHLILSGLSDQNILGQRMASRVGLTTVADEEAVTNLGTIPNTVATGRGLPSRLDRSRIGTQTDQAESGRAWRRIASVAAVGAAVILLSIAASVGYQRWSDSRSADDAIAERGEPVQPVSDPIAGGGPQNALGADQVDGSAERPWVVAADGSGSHRTLAAAIETSQPGDAIRIAPGIYNESVVIRQPISLQGASSDDDPDARVALLQSDVGSPITVDCAEGTVSIAKLGIAGLGHETRTSFNAIDIQSGAVEFADCAIQSTSYNCIKVRRDASLIVKECEFPQSAQFTISASNAMMVEATDCFFSRDGIQLKGGAAVITGCRFFGPKGCSISLSRAPTEIEGCHFENSKDFGIYAESGGIVRVTNSTLNNCETAVSLNIGQMSLGQGTAIEGGRVAIGVMAGRLSVEDVTIEDADRGIVVNDADSIIIENIDIFRCREDAVAMIDGQLRITNARIEGCDNGIVIGGAKRIGETNPQARLVEITVIDSPGFGVAAYAGKTTMTNVSIQGGIVGLNATGRSERGGTETPTVVVDAKNLSLDQQRQSAILAIGNCDVTVRGISIDQVQFDEQAIEARQQVPKVRAMNGANVKIEP